MPKTEDYFDMLRKMAKGKPPEDPDGNHDHQKNHTDRNKPQDNSQGSESLPVNPS